MWSPEEVCPITLQELNQIPLDERYTLVPCLHTFDKTSIFQHFESHNFCPCCRKICTETNNSWTRTHDEQKRIEKQIFEKKNVTNLDLLFEMNQIKTILKQNVSSIDQMDSLIKESVQNEFYVLVGIFTMAVILTCYNFGVWATVCSLTMTSVFNFAYSPLIWKTVKQISDKSIYYYFKFKK